MTGLALEAEILVVWIKDSGDEAVHVAQVVHEVEWEVALMSAVVTSEVAVVWEVAVVAWVPEVDVIMVWIEVVVAWEVAEEATCLEA